MRKIALTLLAAAFILSESGCATVKNTKMPMQFNDLGICPVCRQVIALDGFSDNEIAVCPECGSDFLVKEARYRFKKKCIDLKNRKTAVSVLTVALIAASVAGAIYGIPIPFPPLADDAFTPYKLPAMISCKRAVQPPLSEPKSEIYKDTPDLKPLGLYGTPYNMSAAMNRLRGIYDSPYSMVIVDRYCEGYNISLGRMEDRRYELDLARDTSAIIR